MNKINHLRKNFKDQSQSGWIFDLYQSVIGQTIDFINDEFKKDLNVELLNFLLQNTNNFLTSEQVNLFKPVGEDVSELNIENSITIFNKLHQIYEIEKKEITVDREVENIRTNFIKENPKLQGPLFILERYKYEYSLNRLIYETYLKKLDIYQNYLLNRVVLFSLAIKINDFLKNNENKSVQVDLKNFDYNGSRLIKINDRFIKTHSNFLDYLNRFFLLKVYSTEVNKRIGQPKDIQDLYNLDRTIDVFISLCTDNSKHTNQYSIPFVEKINSFLIQKLDELSDINHINMKIQIDGVSYKLIKDE